MLGAQSAVPPDRESAEGDGERYGVDGRGGRVFPVGPDRVGGPAGGGGGAGGGAVGGGGGGGALGRESLCGGDVDAGLAGTAAVADHIPQGAAGVVRRAVVVVGEHRGVGALSVGEPAGPGTLGGVERPLSARRGVYVWELPGGFVPRARGAGRAGRSEPRCRVREPGVEHQA